MILQPTDTSPLTPLCEFPDTLALPLQSSPYVSAAGNSCWLNINESIKGCQTSDAIDEFPAVLVTVVESEVNSVWSVVSRAFSKPLKCIL